MTKLHRRLVLTACLASFLAAPLSARAGFYQQTNLVSDVQGLAQFTDPNLKNPWGMSSSATSPFWVSNQGSGNSTLYNTAGKPQALVVTIPGGGGPTGQVFNTSTDFALATGGKALFMFANLNGTISGWNGAQGTTAAVEVTTVGASFTGLAIGNNGAGNFLYAADSAGNKIDVFNGTFGATTLAGSFVDPNLAAGFSVYNIQSLGGVLYVTYEHGSFGGGVVDAYDLNGNFLHRVAANDSSGPLQSPWGLALAPSSFGPFGGALLVGNEDDGHISAFDPTTGKFLGQLLGKDGDPIANTGLWGLKFGNDGNGGHSNTLYFNAGINGEQDGLFGSISFVPEPSSIVMSGLAFSLVAGTGWVRRRRAA
ncbi:MAG: TIGR03118 family protein [Paludisphaera borealis]|uniref:TIGR03118 family protein n=1 Tax=Paludisphaera borealis TaxID=1387353 RepID=UPI00284AED0A|nr:TIGR03118 family protein [Paludisphaera borealis]MDR3623488.1 TIGR03118 family protein [Paludisphaera borealis]